MIRVLIIILVILAALFLVGGGYFLGLQSGQSSKSALTTTPEQTTTGKDASSSTQSDSTKDVSATPTPSPEPLNTKTALKEAFESKNFDSLKPNLAETVDLLLYATSCCGASRDQKEIIQFIFSSVSKGNFPWDFELKDEKYKGIKSSLKANEILTVAKSGEAIIFTLDESGKIKKVFSYTDYRLIGS